MGSLIDNAKYYYYLLIFLFLSDLYNTEGTKEGYVVITGKIQ